MRTRFAPSPTGDLHLGGAWTALASWVVARQGGGTFVLRVEDLDVPRVVRGAEARIEEDLRWLGLDWNEIPVRQSERGTLYDDALAKLESRGLTYPCDCSRAEIARVASAPHGGEDVVYPGLCRDLDPERPMKRAPALRIRVPRETIAYEDGAVGHVAQNLATAVGDFILRRGDGVYGYQLAVVVDDLAMRITDVIRGADLIASTPRQIWLATMLDAAPPRYTHVPLVVATTGARLEKRTPGATIRTLRSEGIAPTVVTGALAQGLGLADRSDPASPEDLARQAIGRSLTWRQAPWPIPESWAR